MPDVVWNRPSILAQYADGIKLKEIEQVVSPRRHALERPHWERVRSLLAKLPLGSECLARGSSLEVVLDSDVLTVGSSTSLTAEEHESLRELLQALIPWRKGPFSLFGQQIDAEWRSNEKWDRLSSALPPLSGKRVADIGCNNGYYMFRLLGHALQRGVLPECVIGMDPSESFYFAFELMQRFLQRPELSYELLGAEQIVFFPEFFDLILCLGVIYHQRDPLTMLQNIRQSLRPGGVLLLESQAIPGEAPLALFAPERYAKARNTYFIPTASCLVAWMQRAGFHDVKVVSTSITTSQEQRRTKFAPYESLEDYLDPNDQSKTLEGFPAPIRIMVMGTKGGTLS